MIEWGLRLPLLPLVLLKTCTYQCSIGRIISKQKIYEVRAEVFESSLNHGNFMKDVLRKLWKAAVTSPQTLWQWQPQCSNCVNFLSPPINDPKRPCSFVDYYSKKSGERQSMSLRPKTKKSRKVEEEVTIIMPQSFVTTPPPPHPRDIAGMFKNITGI